MKTLIKNGTVLTPFREIQNGGVLIKNGKIVEVLEAGSPLPEAEEVIDAQGLYISPGFIDVHVHGGGGFEVTNAEPEEIVSVCRAHAKYGTTSILPTTLASSLPVLCKTLDSIQEAQKICTTANILGAHLEGPFLSPAQCGAQAPKYIIPPDPKSVSALLDRWDGIKIMGAAPEIPGGLELGRELISRGITASIAHSDATFEDVERALEYGYEDVTHLYSGCSMTKRINAYRVAGVVEAGLFYDCLSVQVIADGKHLPPSLLKLIYKCKGPDRIVLITDGLCSSAVEASEGTIFTQKNGVRIVLQDGVMKLMDGQSFAGSVATMSRLVRNMIELAGVPILEAVRMASLNPARLARVEDRKGRIAPGYDADIILFDSSIQVMRTLVMGVAV